MTKIIKSILVIILSLFCFIALIRILFKVYRIGKSVIYENLLIWLSAQKNQKVKRFNNSTVTINEQGFRTSQKDNYERK